MATLTEPEAEKLLDDIQSMVDEECPRLKLGFTLKVSEEVIEQLGWTFIIVGPAEGEKRPYEYTDVLVSVEAKLQREKGYEKFMILPVIPA